MGGSPVRPKTVIGATQISRSVCLASVWMDDEDESRRALLVSFLDDDPDYAQWLEAHQDGFVLISGSPPSAWYLVLHKADCRTLNGVPPHPRVKSWTTLYRRTCSEQLSDIEDWTRSEVGSEPSRCRVCFPTRLELEDEIARLDEPALRFGFGPIGDEDVGTYVDRMLHRAFLIAVRELHAPASVADQLERSRVPLENAVEREVRGLPPVRPSRELDQSRRRSYLVQLAALQSTSPSKPAGLAFTMQELRGQLGIPLLGPMDRAVLIEKLRSVTAAPGDYKPGAYERNRRAGVPAWALLAAGCRPTVRHASRRTLP